MFTFDDGMMGTAPTDETSDEQSTSADGSMEAPVAAPAAPAEGESAPAENGDQAAA